ncbi:glucocorticoid modulatory element-binding protein 2 [Chanos chanos]|uniref:Glucocorticoid modulatory element-binding protein 2 n=1 Tax=Chanos chanos TaxID=29144 RepID=A0A6J2UNF5_CHACN|nr:glucocorticoid modulatory element-binding protein 2 [Chanos chanos]
MASSEVSVHVEEVVVVTTPDSLDHGPVEEEMKTVLVTTDLAQPEEDMIEQSLDSETNAAISLPKEAVLVKFSDEVDVEADLVYPITCGDSKATLIWKKFVCPGINIKCVQFHDHLISPKEFVYLAGKSTLKDWKRAIRLNGTMLRKIMDSGELDFYQHSKLCSNTCRSTKIDLIGSRASLSSQQSTELASGTPSSADMNGSQADVSEDSTEWVTAIGEDSMMFWRELRDAGVLDDIMQDFQQEIQETLKGLQDRIQEPPLQVTDAVLLNNIVQNFGMLDLVKKVLASHKSQMDRCREQYTRSLVALEQQCDEHRKRAKELKSKSQHLNNVLMTLTPVATPPQTKRQRLTRAISGPGSVATVTAQATHITLPVTSLASFPLDKMLTASAQPSLLGGYTLLASPGGTELQPDASNLTVLSSAAVQDGTAGATIVKVVSPFQLVTLPALGTGIQHLPAGGTTAGTVVAVPVSGGMATLETVGSQAESTPQTEPKAEQTREK